MSNIIKLSMEELTQKNLSPERPKYNEEDFLREVEEQKKETLQDAEKLGVKILNTIKDRDETAWKFGYLNNFHLRLPRMIQRERIEKIIGNKDLSEEDLERARQEKKLYEDIDAAIQRLGIVKPLTELVNNWNRERRAEGKSREEQCEALVKLYIEMRNLGYNHYPDLVQ